MGTAYMELKELVSADDKSEIDTSATVQKVLFHIPGVCFLMLLGAADMLNVFFCQKASNVYCCETYTTKY